MTRKAEITEVLPSVHEGVLGAAIAERILGTVTTDHAASSYGAPVFVARDGSVYGPGDLPGRELLLHGEERVSLADYKRYDADHAACERAGWSMYNGRE